MTRHRRGALGIAPTLPASLRDTVRRREQPAPIVRAVAAHPARGSGREVVMARRLLVVLGAAMLVLAQAGSALAVTSQSSRALPNPPGAKVDKALARSLANGPTRFVVDFSARPDLAAASRLKDHGKRGQAVYGALTGNAKASQARAFGLAKAKGTDASSYWLANELFVTGDAALAKDMAALPGVVAVRTPHVYPLVKPIEARAAVAAAAGDPEWGVAKIGADAVWAEGITGQGITVATIDTGVDFSHPALVESYRGNNHDGTFTHDYNWWDPGGICDGSPCDNVGHGTHTMGTIAGGDGPGAFTPDTGVAPGATWFAAKGCEDLGCSEESLLSSGQFILAPTDLAGENADPSRRPDVVSNSWGNDNPNDAFYLATVQAWRAAGIIPVFAAGNAGPGCSTAGTPGNSVEVISVGATDSDDLIADFSSRGPSPTDKLSPNVSAPGVDVVSSVPGGGYEAFSGTSMATPHTAGTIALMLSAKPALIGDFDGVLDSLYKTAIDRPDDGCGTPDPSDNDPNYVYGEGRIDAKAAVDLVKTGGTLSGTVIQAGTSAPIAGARVTANDGTRDFTATTDAAGAYSLFLAAGTYGVSVTAFGYFGDVAGGVTIATDETTTRDFSLALLPRFHVTGHVTGAEDGSPLESATVTAVGTPVPGATTDAAGSYDLELPVGSYTLRAQAGGCTDSLDADVASAGDDAVQDFALSRKLDDFGHGCAPIAFDWVTTSGQTALFGDELVGRLALPFDFDFYGTTYGQVFLSDNGYLDLAAPDQFNSLPSAIPSSAAPNAAIYALWQDLRLDEQSHIGFETTGSTPARALVIEYADVLAGASRVSFEIKLWEDGRIDLLYGDNPASPGDGRNATIGIENGAGTDALEFSFLGKTLTANSAFRYEIVPSGLVHGTVTDANDGEPVAGASVTATPGGRTTTTADDGTYGLRLRPGAYTIDVSKADYVPASSPATVTDGGDTTVDVALTAPTAEVDPTTVEASVDYGATTTSTVRISNAGTADLHWTARERSLGADIPPLPTATSVVRYDSRWGRQHIPATFPRVRIADTGDVTLTTIVTDPAGDSLDANDVTAIRAGSDGSSVARIALDYSASTPIDAVGGYVFLDTDQDPSTGLPAEAQFGLPTQDVGMEYFADLFEANGDDPFVPIWSADTFDLVAVVPAIIGEHTIQFDVPLDAVGNDDGFINTDLVTGLLGPSDWAADIGHGAIEPFGDVPWLSETPDSGTVGTSESGDVTLTLGAADLRPGTYHALVVFVTDAPRGTQIPVDVTLHVTMPDAFGEITGTVTDAHTGDSIGGAPVMVHATWNGAPLDIQATTAADGTYDLVGPEGTWPAAYSATGYVTDTHDVTIKRGVTTTRVDAALHLDQAHATTDVGSFTFVLTPGRTGHGTITLGNADGHEPLTFAIDEVKVGNGGGSLAIRPDGVSSRSMPAGHTIHRVAPRDTSEQPADVLVVIDALPWDSDALFRVLSDDGIVFEAINSDSIADLDLGQFSLVIFANDQPQSFYDNYAANFDHYASYVENGGFLWVGAAAQGANGGSLDNAVLPGGATVHDPAYDDANRIADAAHPIVAGMPDPFTGNSASHATFADLPAGTEVIATRSTNDDPTLIEYGLGAGRVLATSQPYDFGLDNGEDTGQILVNAVPYAYDRAVIHDSPWLTESPTAGSVPAGESQAVSVTVDTTGLEPGVYRAGIRIATNDPDNARITVPVILVVPAYQQGVNAGGSTYTDANGDVFGGDRAYGAGPFGYLGVSSTRSTGSAIDGTDDDPLYQAMRQGQTGYRFDVPDGTYRVDLRFAEIVAKKAGARVFSVAIEGQPVLSSLDVYAAAGRNTALDRTVEVEVTDGHLDIAFAAQRGDQPFISAILVTEVPPGGE
jgi:subtilisin family serine protease